jgi:hypothetical protein
MNFRQQTEKLREVMHRAADTIADSILKKNEALTSEELHEIFRTNMDKYLQDLILDWFGVGEPDLWETLVSHDRHDLIDLLHQAEQGMLIGKKVTFQRKGTPDFVMEALKGFLKNHHVMVEVKS